MVKWMLDGVCIKFSVCSTYWPSSFNFKVDYGRAPLHISGGAAASWQYWYGNDVRSSWRFSRFLMIKISIAGPWCMLLSLYLSFIFLIGSDQAIAVHTFCVLIPGWRVPEYISKVVVVMIWCFTALVIAIPYYFHRNERYYGEAGYCKSYIFLFFGLFSLPIWRSRVLRPKGVQDGATYHWILMDMGGCIPNGRFIFRDVCRNAGVVHCRQRCLLVQDI